MHVSIPIKPWHVFTISEVKSDVLPPAFLFVSVAIIMPIQELEGRKGVHQVISINSGPNARIRSMRSSKFCKPWGEGKLNIDTSCLH